MGLSNKIRQNPGAKIKWPVKVGPSNGRMVGETVDVSPNGAFISCQNPLKLNETFEMTIDVPQLGYPLKASAEVVCFRGQIFTLDISNVISVIAKFYSKCLSATGVPLS
jgi:hypothetical protein